MAKARSLNKVMLVGNLTRDPLLRKSSNGVLVCTFGVATNTNWKDGDGNVQERAEFHNIVAFNKLAEICAQVLSTGMLVYLEGEIRTRTKENDSGFKYYKTEVKLNDMLVLNTNDKAPVGVDKAMEGGEKLGKFSDDTTDQVQEPSSTKSNEKSEDRSDEDVDADELF